MERVVYGIYNNDDEVLFIGTARECAKYLKCNKSYIGCLVKNTKNGKITGKRSGYKVYRLFKEG